MSGVTDSSGRRKTTENLRYGLIVAISAVAVPDGWLLCDGTNGTPDLRDRFILGGTLVSVGSAAGTISPAAALTHSGMSATDHTTHVTGQPADHSAHAIGQGTAHSDHALTSPGSHIPHASEGSHQHDEHVGSAGLAGTATQITPATLHSFDGAHTHGAHSGHATSTTSAHSAHSAATLTAHSAHVSQAVAGSHSHTPTQPTHPIPSHILLAYIMFAGR